jgi:hypothetical protein
MENSCAMIVDIHVHTTASADSNVAAEKYLEFAAASDRKIDAVCFTEHRIFPFDSAIDEEYARLADKYGVRIFKGVEADTDLGHLILFGVNTEIARRFDLTSRMLKSEHLIDVVHHEGGVAIPAHPFRDSGFGQRLDALVARHGSAIGAIEAINGQNSEIENAHAIDAAMKLGLVQLGGSDAHFASARWFLTVATELEREVTTAEALCAEIRAGRARPYRYEDRS